MLCMINSWLLLSKDQQNTKLFETFEKKYQCVLLTVTAHAYDKGDCLKASAETARVNKLK